MCIVYKDVYVYVYMHIVYIYIYVVYVHMYIMCYMIMLTVSVYQSTSKLVFCREENHAVNHILLEHMLQPFYGIHWLVQRDNQQYLVGGIPTHLKNMNANWDDELPNIWENKSHVPAHQPLIFRCVWLS